MPKPRSVTAEVESILGPAPASYAQPEAAVLRFRRHGRRLVPPAIAMLAAAAAAGYWVGALPAVWMNLLAAAGAALLGLLLGVLPVLAWLAHRTTVTTRRVIVRRGLFVHRRSEVSLSRVREVRTRRGPLQRLRGSGDIELLHGAESMRLEDVPGVQVVADALRELMERNYEHATRLQQRLAAQVGGFGGPGAGPGAGAPFGSNAAAQSDPGF
ncbi:PH domain-containing protein [Leucobacter sp. wl10]|uniref:PH domain-containing protein n=1 Tax=Leucobacter sp. wl10 TaxID=2304677 RepID=UPI001F08A64F|nr:PH domain-containing protein [Leucobacter sp. wl10]